MRISCTTGGNLCSLSGKTSKSRVFLPVVNHLDVNLEICCGAATNGKNTPVVVPRRNPRLKCRQVALSEVTYVVNLRKRPLGNGEFFRQCYHLDVSTQIFHGGIIKNIVSD